MKTKTIAKEKFFGSPARQWNSLVWSFGTWKFFKKIALCVFLFRMFFSEKREKCDKNVWNSKVKILKSRDGHLGGKGRVGGALYPPPTFYRFLLNYENSHYFLVLLSKFVYDKTFLKQQSAHNSIFYKQFGFKKLQCVSIR